MGSGHVLQTLLFIVLCAAAHSVQAIQTETGQKHVDVAATLLAEVTRLAKNGAFRNADISEDS